MLNLEKAKKSPNLFRRLTGISLQEFDELMAVLKKAYPDYERRRLSRREREREIGAGGKFKLSFAREGLYDPFLSSPLSYLC